MCDFIFVTRPTMCVWF